MKTLGFNMVQGLFVWSDYMPVHECNLHEQSCVHAQISLRGIWWSLYCNAGYVSKNILCGYWPTVDGHTFREQVL